MISMSEKPWKPTKEQIEKARDKTVPDIIAPSLKVLFCGINPGLYTAAVGHHFARPGNRFWPVLYFAGFTPRQLSPFEERELLNWGYGITNIVERASANATDLCRQELENGGRELVSKVLRFSPCILAVLGVGAYKASFNTPLSRPGLQQKRIGSTSIWVLPNTSGINANYQIEELVKMFKELKNFAEGCE